MSTQELKFDRPITHIFWIPNIPPCKDKDECTWTRLEEIFKKESIKRCTTCLVCSLPLPISGGHVLLHKTVSEFVW